MNDALRVQKKDEAAAAGDAKWVGLLDALSRRADTTAYEEVLQLLETFLASQGPMSLSPSATMLSSSTTAAFCYWPSSCMMGNTISVPCALASKRWRHRCGNCATCASG